MKKAVFFRDRGDKKVECLLCAHQCAIKDGSTGRCMVRKNIDGVLYALTYNGIVSEAVDPIEKKPLFHFLPQSLSYSISSVGCNFRCLHCQNWQLSQYPRLIQKELPATSITPADVVSSALSHGAKSISYTYVEPTIFYEFAYECSTLAMKQGLLNCFVSNGFMTEAVVDELSRVIQGINIDLKAFSDRFYKEVCGARLEPVLRSIERFVKNGVWVEVTTLIIPQMNDSEDELREIARFISSLSPDIPWHVTAFRPCFKLTASPPTPVSTLQRAREIGLNEGLRYVYQGNAPLSGGEDTVCYNCNTVLIRRYGFSVLENRLNAQSINGAVCSRCGAQIKGVFSTMPTPKT